MSSSDCSISVNPVDTKTVEEIQKNFRGLRCFNEFVRIGPKGYISPKYPDMEEQISLIYNLSFRPSDTIVLTFPRSGTTWTQELVWLVVNDLDYDTAKSKNLFQRYNYIEYARTHVEEHLQSKKNSVEEEKMAKMMREGWGLEVLDALPDPRFIKTHIALSLLPPNVLDTAKIVYVARDPRDVAVSYFHLNRLIPRLDFIGDFKTFWTLFFKDSILRSPYFEHVKEAWGRRDHPNFLFLFYEELSENLFKTVERVCDFFGKRYTDEEISKLCEHLKHENFKKNPATNMDFLKNNYFLKSEGSEFIGRGKAGGWRDYFDEEMSKQAEAWIENNLRDTDLRFPQVSAKKETS